MDSARFDGLTKLLAGGVSRRESATGLAALMTAAVVNLHAANAKKKRKKRKRRCNRLTQRCGKAKKKRCCAGLRCDDVKGAPGIGKRCCHRVGKRCRDPIDCCGDLACDPVDSVCCRGFLSVGCTSDAECCDDFLCIDSTCI